MHPSPSPWLPSLGYVPDRKPSRRGDRFWTPGRSRHLPPLPRGDDDSGRAACDLAVEPNAGGAISHSFSCCRRSPRWVAINLIVTSTLAGEGHPASEGLETAGRATASTVGTWVYADHLFVGRAAVTLLALATVPVLRRLQLRRLEVVALPFCGLYVALVVVSATSVSSTRSTTASSRRSTCRWCGWPWQRPGAWWRSQPSGSGGAVQCGCRRDRGGMGGGAGHATSSPR
jgi:hypothetical protein